MTLSLWPASCTTLATEDPYTHFAGPEALFRFPDLMALSELIGLVREGGVVVYSTRSCTYNCQNEFSS